MKVITIGRHEDNDVLVDDPCASRHHLQIIQHDDGHYSLADFGSTNGTFINGQQITGEVDLNINDVVRIGNSTIPWRLFFEKEEPKDIQEENPSSYDETELVSSNPTMPMKQNRLGSTKTWLWIILGGLFAVAIIVYVLCYHNSNNQKNKTLKYSDIQALFVSGNDIYGVGSAGEGTSETDVPTLWKNGVAQKIGNMGNFNNASSVFVSGDDVYVTINDRNSHQALLWKNGESQLLAEGLDAEANCVFVYGKDVYVAGQKDGCPTVWKNGIPNILGESGSAESVVVKDGKVYMVGYIGEFYSGDAFLYVALNSSDTMVWNLEMMNRANSVFVADNGDIYVAGMANDEAVLWKNGDIIDLGGTGKGSAESVAVNNTGDIVVTGIALNPNSNAVVWVNGKRTQVNDVLGYQAMTVVTDGSSFYIGGCGKDGQWSVWKYDGKSDFSLDNLVRVSKE